MTSTTLPLRIKREHLPNSVLASIGEVFERHAYNLVDTYEMNLGRNGLRLSLGDREEIVRHLKYDAKVVLSISMEINDKKMDEEWNIHPIPLTQSTLSVFRSEETFSQGELESLEQKDAELYEKRKAAAKATDEGMP